MAPLAIRALNQATKDALYKMPAASPPPGVVSNLINPPNRLGLALGIIITCLILVIIMTLLRVYTKIFIERKMNLEDYLLPIAFAAHVGLSAIGLHISTYNPVLHQWDMSIGTLSRSLLDFHIAVVLFNVTVLILKACILVQFIRLFIVDKRASFWISHALIWINVIFNVILIFLEILACRPVAKLWDPLREGKCLNIKTEYIVCAFFNFALDAIILIWTQKVIWSLHMPFQRKLRVAVLFVAGVAACAFAGLRAFESVKLLTTNDVAYLSLVMGLYTYPETASGFLILCLPTMPKLYKSVRDTVSSRNTSGVRFVPSGEPDSNERQRPRKSWFHIPGGSMFSRITGRTETRAVTNNNKTGNERKAGMSFITFKSFHMKSQFDCETSQASSKQSIVPKR